MAMNICLYSKKIFRNLGVTSQKFPLFPPVFSSQKKFPPSMSGKMACFWMWEGGGGGGGGGGGRGDLLIRGGGS